MFRSRRMEVNNILIQPEAWDFNKTKLSNPDLKDRMDTKTAVDKTLGDAEQDGTQVTLSVKGLALSRSNEEKQIPDILVKTADEKEEEHKSIPQTIVEKSPVENIADTKISNVGILSLEERKDIAKMRR